jgi:triose/dihydroxyacetone kinase / FAD-AMP lyase (cyclizing)
MKVPGTAPLKTSLAPDEIEIGMGIHGEPGNRHISPIPPLKGLVFQLLEMLTSTADTDRAFLPFNGSQDSVVVLVNNLGGTSELEMGGIVAEVRQSLDEMGILIRRLISGTFMVRAGYKLEIKRFE